MTDAPVVFLPGMDTPFAPTSEDERAAAIEAAFRRRTLDEVYGYDAESIARLSPHAISPARLAGV